MWNSGSLYCRRCNTARLIACWSVDSEETAFNCSPLTVSTHNIFLSLPACLFTSSRHQCIELLDSVYGYAKNLDRNCDLTCCMYHKKKNSNLHLYISLGSHFELHNNDKPFFWCSVYFGTPDMCN